MTDCYLCGGPLDADVSADHVPPKQFYAKSIRGKFNLSKLTVLPAHVLCNGGYSKDEEYFRWALAPLALDSFSGGALAGDNAAKFRTGASVPLGFKTLKEFERNPSGLHLPPNIVVKRLEQQRIVRVAWKIVRGLFAAEHAEVLPEDTPFMVESFEPMMGARSAENPVWDAVKAQPGKGVYPGVFDYKYLVGDDGGLKLHVWGMLFWDRIMFFVAHHPPDR